jgi:hypothetical protein
MDTAVIKDEHTVFCGVWIHHGQETFEPQQELVSVVATCFDMAIYDALCRKCRQKGVSARPLCQWFLFCESEEFTLYRAQNNNVCVHEARSEPTHFDGTK